MMHPAEPDWNVTSEDFADEGLASLLRGDWKSKVGLGASMHMLKIQLLTAKLGKTAWKALGVLHSQIMAQRQPVCQQQSDGMDYEVRQTSSRSAKLQTSVSRAPPLREQFLDEAQAAREELLAEIQRSAESDAGEDPAEDKQADDVTFGHKMMYPSEPDWNVTSDEFADEDLASLLRGDGKKKIDLVASMHMLKLQCLTAKLGPSTIAWNDKSAMHVPDKAALGVLDSQIMA